MKAVWTIDSDDPKRFVNPGKPGKAYNLRINLGFNVSFTFVMTK